MKVRRFVTLERQAQRALKKGNMAKIEEINKELVDIGIKLIVRNGELWVKVND